MCARNRCTYPLQLDTSHDGPCFDDWADDSGGGKWVKQWGSAPAAGTLKVATCNKLLGWYPAFAGRYTSAWGKEYGACKERELHKPGDYYSQRMWPICRPAAMLAHDSAMGRGGVGQEATPPFVMRTLYGQGRAKVVSALRHPVDRLETSFWVHVHYPKKYGASPTPNPNTNPNPTPTPNPNPSPSPSPNPTPTPTPTPTPNPNPNQVAACKAANVSPATHTSGWA